MKTKVCVRCKKELTIDNFYIDKNGKISSYCKECEKERKKNVKPIKPPEDLNFYKVCSICGQRKLATEFSKHSRRKDGLSTECKDCSSKRQKQYKEKYKDNETPKTKICPLCNKEKPASEFGYSSRNPDHLGTYCKACHKSYYTDNRLEYVKQHKITLPDNYTKVCNICYKEKPASEFYKSSYNIDGLQYVCKECEKREERKLYNIEYGKRIITKICKICGNEYRAARYSSDRCPNCRQHTIPEEIFIQLLNKYSVKFETEYKVNDLNIWCDFYLVDYNILIDINPTSTHSIIGKEGIFEAKSKDYHINRRKQIVENGYVYVSIWDWDRPENIIKAILNNSLIIDAKDYSNVFWCKNNLSSLKWGKYNKEDILSNEIKEGYLPVYDDGQTLIY